MKILEISDLGIYLKENGEVLNQGIYDDVEDIPFEVYQLISEFSDIGEIKICIQTKIQEDIYDSIIEIIKEKRGTIYQEKKRVLNFKYIIMLIAFGSFVIFFLFLYIYRLNMDIKDYKKELYHLKIVGEKNLKRIDLLIKENNEEKIVFVEKKKLKIEELLFEFNKDIFLEKVELKEKEIIFQGVTKDFISIVESKARFEKYFKNIDLKLDHIKKEGDGLRFLMEISLKKEEKK